MASYFAPWTEQSKYLPESFNLLQFAGGVEYQGQTSNCGGNAIVSMFEIMLAEAGQSEELSRLYPYFYGRENYPDLAGVDSGMILSAGLEAVVEHGIPSESKWAYDLSQVNTEPSLIAQEDAQRNTLSEYFSIITNAIDTLKLAITWGYPVLTSIRISEQFATLGENDVYIGIGDDYAYSGVHALVAVGYDSDSILYENSYGDQWGNQGYVSIPYDVVQEDIWAMYMVKGFSSFDLTSDEVVINGLYLTILDRVADSGGLDYWSGTHASGTIFRDVARAIYGSNEHKTNSNDTIITDCYHEILGREPDAVGYAYWNSSNLPVAEIAATFYASAEFTTGW